LNATNTEYDDDTFCDEHFKNLLTADLISDVIEYSINEAVSTAASYKLDIKEFNSMRTELLAGIFCPVSRKYMLYEFRWKSKQGHDGVLVPYTEKKLIGDKDVVVLGLSKYKDDAQAVYDKALAEFSDPGPILFEYLNKKIDESKDSGSKQIDRPSVLKVLQENKLMVSKHRT
jgi:hypothetical protein